MRTFACVAIVIFVGTAQEYVSKTCGTQFEDLPNGILWVIAISMLVALAQDLKELFFSVK